MSLWLIIDADVIPRCGSYLERERRRQKQRVGEPMKGD
jgi:hypothetical protein